jgi:protein-arginine kinase activator protein McsA
VLESAGIILDQDNEPPKGAIVDEISEPEYQNLSTEELERAIKKAVKNEDYEKAAQLRDEISKRDKST